MMIYDLQQNHVVVSSMLFDPIINSVRLDNPLSMSRFTICLTEFTDVKSAISFERACTSLSDAPACSFSLQDYSLATCRSVWMTIEVLHGERH
jgi:hypothetical protein